MLLLLSIIEEEKEEEEKEKGEEEEEKQEKEELEGKLEDIVKSTTDTFYIIIFDVVFIIIDFV